MNLCPRCESRGRSIKPATLRAQVKFGRLARIIEHEGWRLCTSEVCDVVYFCDDQVVTLDEAHGVPFHKSADPQRLVCFCFEHSVADIKADVTKNETSSLQASIKAECAAGRDDCERKNPQGRCCLGNVGQVVKRANPNHADGGGGGCCEDRGTTSHTPSTPDPSARSGLLASAGALVAAVLSSTCCWLPLLAIGFGASTNAVAFFGAWRVPLLLSTVVLLGAGFYLTYREPRCATSETCEAPDVRIQHLNRWMLWLTTVFVVAFALFPEYAGVFTGGGKEVAKAALVQMTVSYQVEGMTCAGCEGHTREAIEAIPGVVSVSVSYRARRAEVVWSGEPNDIAVVDAVMELGYRANPLR